MSDRKNFLLLDLQGEFKLKKKSAPWGQELLEACDGLSTVCVENLQPLTRKKVSIFIRLNYASFKFLYIL